MSTTNSMDILEILSRDSRTTPDIIAAMLNLDEQEVIREIKKMEDDNIILKYNMIINEEIVEDPTVVHALIEVKVVPQPQAGYEAIAESICRYEHVRACYLMSGSYDYAIFIDGKSIRDISLFVTEKLSTLDGVTSTATHFVLRKYKDNHVFFPQKESDHRQVVTP